MSDTSLIVGESCDAFNVVPKAKGCWYGSELVLIIPGGEGLKGSDFHATVAPHRSRVSTMKVANRVRGVLELESMCNDQRARAFLGYMLVVDLQGMAGCSSLNYGIIRFPGGVRRASHDRA
ncbi:hypothetical protein RSOLAG22IIIB_02872 [Rhizoctonia solani]|uniref:Uncharacterized protein n=1 Tax=Rhizoctonia solani TaxID=456999 RepID=A0A0K6FLW3_9AGAM|nr:hypothetical protein RSOLAG22IIIB_02872 [Rhizoctonia solani]